MNTSTYKPGLYGEYALLDDGLYDNGTIDTSKIKNSKLVYKSSFIIY